MRYVGLQTQIWRNNRNTVILLFMFPVILLGMVFLVILGLDFFGILCDIVEAALRTMLREQSTVFFTGPKFGFVLKRWFRIR